VSLKLDRNNLSGTIPEEIGNLTQLTRLYLTWNKFTGSIPTEIGNLSNLLSLQIEHNQLTGSIPIEIGNLTQLTSLDLGRNQLTGNIPSEIENLVQLQYLRLDENQLSGSIPHEIGYLIQLKEIALQSNQLTGNIPSEIGNLTQLSYLNMGYNQFIGNLPNEIGNLSQLIRFYLNNNQLTNLPNLSNLTNLFKCYISNNKFEFNDLENANIDWSSISYKTYSPQAEIPISKTVSGDNATFTVSCGGSNNTYKWYKEYTIISGENTASLTVDNTTDAYYHCEIEDTNFPELKIKTQLGLTGNISITNGVLSLDYNALLELYNSTDGDNWTNNTNWKSAEDVINWYGITVKNSRVTKVKMYYNNLTGSLPSDIGNLRQLTEFNLGSNHLTGNIPTQIGNLTNLNKLYLHNNQLSDNIPSEIGNLTNLNELYIGNNQITGSIPTEIGNLTSLFYLHLDDNKFTDLPDLSSLTNLGICSIENNNFEFDDLETASIDWSSISYKSYSPQAEIPISKTISGDNATFNVSCGGSNNTYKWYKDDIIINGETNSSITVDNTADALYYCKVTDTNYPDLEIKTYLGGTGDLSITNGVYTDEYNALIEFYNNSDGNTWTNNTNWKTSERVENWFGISVSNLHVTKIDLRNNNLYKLSDISSFENLTTLYLQSNRLEFDDFDDLNSDFTGFAYNISDQAKIPIVKTENSTSVTYTVNCGGTNNTYTWYNCGNTIEGETSNSITVNNNEIGTFYCKVSDTNYYTDIESNASILGNVIKGVFEDDYDALIELYNSTNGDSWTDNTNWNSLEDVEDWFGISVQYNHVDEINLSSNNLTGIIPADIQKLVNLEVLNLRNNQITGSIPSEIGSLNKLKELYLNSNQINNSIPIEIGNLTSLERLYLNNNQLNDTIPDEVCNINNLISLRLNNNYFVGNMPSINNYGIDTICLNNNMLTGNISEITYYTGYYLKVLDLSYNSFTGNMPNMHYLRSITELKIASNRIDTIHSSLSNLSHLKVLHLDNNRFINLPTIPASVTELHIANNLLTFEDIEPLMPKLNAESDYSPQYEYFLYKTTGGYCEGGDLNLDINDFSLYNLGGNNNRYQWFNGPTAISSVSESPIYTKVGANSSDDGTYYCHVTNVVVSGLTLDSYGISIYKKYPFNAFTITGDTLLCAHSSTYIYKSDEIGYADEYVWTLPSGASGISTSRTISVSFNEDVTGDIKVHGEACGSSGSDASLYITAIKNTPSGSAIIDGNEFACLDTLTYSVNNMDGASSYLWYVSEGTTITSNSTEANVSIDFSQAQQNPIIKVKGINICGEGTEYSLNISNNKPVNPQIKTKWDNLLICLNVGDSIDTYQWYKNGNIIDGATNQFYNTNGEVGVYSVKCVDENKCSNISNQISFGNKFNVKLFPNPANTNLNINIENKSESEDATILIYNLLGKEVLNYNIKQTSNIQNLKMPISNIEDGVYIIYIKINNELKYSSKFIIKK